MTRLVRIRERGPVPGVMRRDLNNASKAAWLVCGHYWGANIRAKHFTEDGAREYRYKPRSREYNAHKLQEYGHRNPLVYSGESEGRSESYRVESTYKGAYIPMSVPALNWSGRGGEMNIVSAGDAKEIAKVWEAEYAKRVEELKSHSETINL